LIAAEVAKMSAAAQIHILISGFYQDTLGLGEIADIGGNMLEYAMPPVGCRGRAPGHEVGGRSPPEAENLLLHK